MIFVRLQRMKMDVALAFTVILNAVKDLLYVFDPLETDNKQILRRCAPQNDIDESAWQPTANAYNPNFRRSARRTRRIRKLIFSNFLTSCSS
jgi:hypothetical protein